MTPTPTKETLRESLAAIIHEQWAHWTKYMLDHMTQESIKRWRQQIETPYSELSDKEKDSDRNLVAPYLELIEGEKREARHKGYEAKWPIAKRQERQRIREALEGMKRKPKTKSGHGNCCTCQGCGFYHDDCECEHNRAIDLALKAIDA